MPKTIKTIGIIATARAIDTEKLQNAIADLENWGIKVEIGKSIGKVSNQFAGTDALRAEDLQAMLQNPQIDAILCAKGGYGTARILDLIDWKSVQEKPILGFSDITALHCHVHNLGWQSVHSVMGSTWKTATPSTLRSIYNYFFGSELSYEFSTHKFNKLGTVNAPIIGGNLSVIYSIVGSKSEVDFSGKILFLEDLDEYLYHTDRMMLCLKRAGKLENLAALLVGSFSNMHDNAIPFGKTAYEIIFEHTKTYNYPKAYGFPCGHTNENLTLPFGKNTTLTIQEKMCQLTINN